ncbi:predicted protein [Uncinocarpus reesii 1704]|uniref:SEC7 domain-containing protein n=1 Tax=Uncinocarpus reesii (strain UAMH 1704) TaxID=336963 RepID=C4JWK0_UNCRE|nr:uncharacterized protein UREG_06942 [Uncinocarpus reesii 1704]EEP82077.1 predicted protein [Uncinocarpus reesii 1704]
MSAYQMFSQNPWQHDPYYDNSPPRTPGRNTKHLGGRNRRLANRSSFPETFLDDLTPVDANQQEDSEEEEKDPHDLSLSPRHATRASIVDNMLLSLDQFSDSNFNTAGEAQRYQSHEPDPYILYSRYATAKRTRHRGHTFSSSLSSEIGTLEENGGRYSSHSGRGRRSNSSSNFQSTMRKVDGFDGADKSSNRSRVFEAQRATMGNQSSRYLRNGSRSSDSSNIDINQMLTGGHIGRARRSISFDYGTNGASTLSVDNPMLHYDDINAAPTPHVPAGPRRAQSPAFKDLSGDQQGAAASARPPALSRKNSTKSARSMYNKRGRPDTLGTTSIKGRPGDSRYLREAPPDIPPIPTHIHRPAPSPTIAFHKSSQFPPVTESITPPPAKERYGFFRRVFGSYKSSPPTQLEKIQGFVGDSEIFSQPRESQSAPNSSKGYPTQGQLNGGQDNVPVVTKKPSSFFRRRKRSTTDHVPSPLVIPNSNMKPRYATGHVNAEGSPSGSLRQIMKPYLADSSSPGLDHSKPFAQSEVHLGELDVDAGNQQSNPKPVPYDRPRNKWVYADGGPQLSHNKGSNIAKSNLKPNLTPRDRDGSFLADSSGNEGAPTQSSENSSRRPMTSPVPETSSHKCALNGNGANKDSKIGARVNNKLSVNTTLKMRDETQLESASSTDAKQGFTKPKGASDSVSQSPPISASTTASHYQTAFNTPLLSPAEDPSLKLGKKLTAPTPPIKESIEELNEPTLGSSGIPSASDRERALKLYEDTSEDNSNEELTATWLGNPHRAGIRKAYMDLFDWLDMNILAALRSLCSKIALKGETQQVDRVLDAFSTRWCECNPKHGFKATDVVHTICYSLLLLNTDLHMADIDQKMTRSQFIRNTMPTIQRVVEDAAPDAFETINPSAKLQRPRSIYDTGMLPRAPTPYHEKNETEVDTASSLLKPQDQAPKSNTVTNISTLISGDMPSSSGQLNSMPFRGTQKAWENQVELVLKDFYNSIQKRRLPLRGIQAESEEQQPSNNFLTLTGNMLRRTPSTLSRATAPDVFSRGRSSDNRLSTARWASKPRSRPRVYPPSAMTSSRTSLDDQSVWSPTASSTWSKASLGKTLTSMSVDTLGSDYPRPDYQQSIGFANALSHAIIREDSASFIVGAEDSTRAEALLEDETLELAGAPWAKEGSMKHKHHLDSVDKRAKDRNWNETFAVIQRGWMRLFSFNSSTKSMRLKPKQRQNGGIVVGGGNWMENAEETWKFLLRHTIASALPQPGYSKSRPYVWALSLPTGAVHLFQVGTPEIVKEFVSTANYWSARLSKEPMFGGISNIEYGWSDAVINRALAQTDDHKPMSSSGTRVSIQSSIRSSLDQQSVRPRLPADRIHISDWTPPQQSMIASSHSEEEQLTGLRSYVQYVEEELKRHNELRTAMLLAFTPRHPNATKALANWERKSSYLLREIVKFRTYIDCLQAAQVQKEKFYSSPRLDEAETANGEQA